MAVNFVKNVGIACAELTKVAVFFLKVVQSAMSDECSCVVQFIVRKFFRGALFVGIGML